jgi:hypothetical protein
MRISVGLFALEKSSLHVIALQQFLTYPAVDISGGVNAKMKPNFRSSWMVRLAFWK